MSQQFLSEIYAYYKDKNVELSKIQKKRSSASFSDKHHIAQ